MVICSDCAHSAFIGSMFRKHEIVTDAALHISLVFAQKRSLTFSDDIQNIGATVHHGSIYNLRLLPNKASKAIAKLEGPSTF